MEFKEALHGHHNNLSYSKQITWLPFTEANIPYICVHPSNTHLLIFYLFKLWHRSLTASGDGIWKMIIPWQWRTASCWLMAGRRVPFVPPCCPARRFHLSLLLVSCWQFSINKTVSNYSFKKYPVTHCLDYFISRTKTVIQIIYLCNINQAFNF